MRDGPVRTTLRLHGDFPGGHRALLDIAPATERPRASILVIQPFAEEANFARRVLVAQGRLLAASGFAVCLPDLLGTGDSAGDFADATVDAWLADIEAVARRLRERDGAPLVMWGARFGALLARHAAARIRPDLVIEWDPVRDGRTMLAQFRRLARLSGLATATGPSSAAMAGVPDAILRLAGYSVTPALAAGIEALGGDQAGADWPIVSLKSPAAYWLEQAPSGLATLHDAMEAALDDRFPSAPSFCAADPGPPPVSTIAGERSLAIETSGRTLHAVLHLPDRPASIGLIIVPGRPQTRVGSHRMFVQLARACRDRGIAVLRHDHAGFGDSDGEPLPFDADTADLSAVIHAFRAAVPGCGRVALWGLCDGATSAIFAAARAGGVDALIGLNPWVHDRTLRARSMLRTHYRRRLLDPAFWKRLSRGEVRVAAALREALGHVVRSLRLASSSPVPAPASRPTSTPAKDDRPVGSRAAGGAASPGALEASGRSLPDSVREALAEADLPTCLLLSGQDMTAAEMSDLLGTRKWRRLRRRLVVRRIPEGDHTLSVPGTLEQAIAATIAFLEGQDGSQAPGGTAS